MQVSKMIQRCFLIAFLAPTAVSFAGYYSTSDLPWQDGIVVTGKVFQAGSEAPLAGATVELKGSKIKTTTDSKGAFTIKATSASSILMIS
jgi:hypothetical protein